MFTCQDSRFARAGRQLQRSRNAQLQRGRHFLPVCEGWACASSCDTRGAREVYVYLKWAGTFLRPAGEPLALVCCAGFYRCLLVAIVGFVFGAPLLMPPRLRRAPSVVCLSVLFVYAPVVNLSIVISPSFERVFESDYMSVPLVV